MTDHIRRVLAEEERMRQILDRNYPHNLSAITSRSPYDAALKTFADIDSLQRLKLQAGLTDEVSRQMQSLAERDAQTRALVASIGGHALFTLEAALGATIQPDAIYRRLQADEMAAIADAKRAVSPTLADILTRFGESASFLEKALHMERDWVNITNPAQSIIGFAEMQGIGATLRLGAPYGDATKLMTQEVLGDWSRITLPEPAAFADAQFATDFYIRHGFNTELADFTVPAYEEGMDSAGFRPFIDLTEDIDDVEANLRRNNEAHNVIQRVEYHARRFIEKKMLEHCGAGWYKQRVPEPVKRNIAERRATENADKIKNEPLLDFADFGDLWLIMERRDNWSIFEHYFLDKEDAKISFRRLLHQRNPVSHARFIGNLNCTLVRVEGTRVLLAMGVTDSVIIR